MRTLAVTLSLLVGALLYGAYGYRPAPVTDYPPDILRHTSYLENASGPLPLSEAGHRIPGGAALAGRIVALRLAAPALRVAAATPS